MNRNFYDVIKNNGKLSLKGKLQFSIELIQEVMLNEEFNEDEQNFLARCQYNL